MQITYLTKFNTLHDLKKKSKELQIKGNYFNVIKAICKKPIENIILKDERWKAFP